MVDSPSASLHSQQIPPSVPHHPGIGWSFFWILVFLVLTQVPGALIATGILFAQMFQDPEKSRMIAELGVRKYLGEGHATLALLSGLGLAQLLTWVLGITVSQRVLGKDWRTKIGLVPTNSFGLLMGLFMGAGMFLLAEGLVHLIRSWVPHIAGESELKGIFSPWPWFLGVLIIGLGPGIGEEIWCRGFLGQGLVGRLGILPGVIWTSFFFGLMHIDPAQAIYAGVLGVFLHGLRLGTGSLFPAIIAHTVNNSVSMLGVCADSPFHSSLEHLESLIKISPLATLILGLTFCGSISWLMWSAIPKPNKQSAT